MTRNGVASLMALPAFVAALGIITLEGWRLYQPRSPLYTTPFAYSLAEAIALDDGQRAYEFLRAGQDPNEPIAVRHPLLTNGRGVLVSPLVWAVALQREQIVLMLLGFGAHTERESDRNAACLADRLRNPRIAGLLRQHGAIPSPGACSAPRPDEPPIFSFLAEPR